MPRTDASTHASNGERADRHLFVCVACESIRERDLRATIHPDTWNVPTTTLTEEQKTRRYLRLIWISPIVMTLLGIAFLFLNTEKPWLPWAAFALAIVGVIGAVVETRK
jgi:hypothetical protein